jgi:hypothetical protein
MKQALGKVFKKKKPRSVRKGQRLMMWDHRGVVERC